MGKVILIGATKGGVGKSVSSYNLAYSLASFGKKVLAVDLDSQANLTTCLRRRYCSSSDYNRSSDDGSDGR